MGILSSTSEAGEMDDEVFEIIASMRGRPLLEALRAVQRQKGCLTEEALAALAKDRLISRTRLFGIATSYPEFKFEKEIEEPRPVSPSVELPDFLAGVAGLEMVIKAGVLTEWFSSRPGSIAEYRAAGGLKALGRALEEMRPEQIFSEIVLGGITRKPEAWQLVEKSTEGSVIVANVHSGDPFAGQTRLLVERDPYAVLEGMFIAARALGASRGFLFLAPESAAISEKLAGVAEEVQRAANINFAVEVVAGPQSLVGSEDSAAVGCLERDRPMPFPMNVAIRGVWAKPTLVDSVECFASITATLARGKLTLARLYQVSGAGREWVDFVGHDPGITVAELLAYSVTDFSASVLVGGLSGRFVSGEELQRPMSSFERTDSPRWRTLHVFESGADILKTAGQLAAYNARYLCGYCIPCRIGAVRMAELLARAKGQEESLDRKTLGELAWAVERSGLCHSGRGAAEMVLSALLG